MIPSTVALSRRRQSPGGATDSSLARHCPAVRPHRACPGGAPDSSLARHCLAVRPHRACPGGAPDSSLRGATCLWRRTTRPGTRWGAVGCGAKRSNHADNPIVRMIREWQAGQRGCFAALRSPRHPSAWRVAGLGLVLGCHGLKSRATVHMPTLRHDHERPHITTFRSPGVVEAFPQPSRHLIPNRSSRRGTAFQAVAPRPESFTTAARPIVANRRCHVPTRSGGACDPWRRSAGGRKPRHPAPS